MTQKMYNKSIMKTIFIINPKAGKGKGLAALRERIAAAAAACGQEAGIYLTKGVGDAESFARAAAAEYGGRGEELHLIACGGDGTINEVVNGVLGAAGPIGKAGTAGAAGLTEAAGLTGATGTAVGAIPIGTGNDFLRNFPKAGDFLDIGAQLEAAPVFIDLLKYSGELDGRSAERYCVNMFNIGFDSNVADLTARLKRYPLLSGSLAYLAAVVGMLVKKKGANLRIELDGEEVYAGPLLLTALANGCYCGGGIKSSPRALPDDGIMDVNIIYDVSRREFVSKFPAYTRGTHLELEDIDRLLYFSQCSRAKITPLCGSMRLCVDGEIMDAGPISIEVVPQALRFLLPPGKE